MIKKSFHGQEEAEFVAYDKALDCVKDEINRVLSSSPRIIRAYTEHLKASTGKFIRAISVITCAQNEEGNVPLNGIKFAAAIELFHLATLVHDDVIDNADLRRGELTLQKKFGKRTAVICGDYVFSMALRMAESGTNKEKYADLRLPDYISRVCLGELKQHVNNRYFDLSVPQYLRIISGKTAALFEASFCGGAILADFDERTIGKYMKLGRYIGMIFQITDDCSDFETSREVMGKPVQSDFEQGVITLPLIYAFRKITGLKEKAEAQKLTRQDINGAVGQAAGLEQAKRISKQYYEKARRIVDDLDLKKEKREGLLEILHKAYGAELK